MKKKKIPVRKKKKVIQNSSIVRAEVKLAFKEPLPETSPVPVKASVKKPERDKKQFRYESSVDLDKASKIVLTRLFLNHERIIKHAKEALVLQNFRNEKGFRDYIEKWVRETGMTPVILSSVNIDLFYLFRNRFSKAKKNGKKFYIPFVEGSLTNNRFTIAKGRDRIFFEDLDILLRLKTRMSSLLKEGEGFNLNLGTTDCRTLEGLFINVFSIKKQK